MKNRKFRTSLIIVLMIALSLSMFATTALAATNNYGTVTVNSRWSSDGSAKQVTVNCTGTGWTTSDGITVTGTVKVTLPEGYFYGNPTAEQVWAFVAYGYNGNGYNGNNGNNGNWSNSYADGYGMGDYTMVGSGYTYVGAYNGDYYYDGSRYVYVGTSSVWHNPAAYTSYNNGNNWNNSGITKGYRTAAQQIAEAIMNKVRDEGSKTYPWSTSYVPSTTFTPKEDHCWYQFSTTLTVSYWGADGRLHTSMSTYSYSVETKRVDGVWTTYFNGVNNADGSSVTLTAEDVISDMKDAGDEVAKDLNMRISNQQPWALIKTSTTSAAVQQVKTKLEDCGYSVSLSNSAYGTDYGTVTMRLSRSGYSGSTTVNLIVERYDSGSFWATFTGADNRMFTLKQLLSLYQKTSN